MSDHIEKLLQTIHTLRAPGGCPWDRKQTLHDAARYLMDEAAEVIEATLENKPESISEELADVLFMTCFCIEIHGESAGVNLQGIARLGHEKLVRRHPHVFGDAHARNAGHSQELWNQIKAEEKRAKGLDPDHESALKDLPASTSPLHQAVGYQKDAAHVGFDWDDVTGVWAKLHEELDELREAVANGGADHIRHELGDLLFSVANLGRWLAVEPDIALRRANQRFQRRFHWVEGDFRDRGVLLADANLDELEAAWLAAKAALNDATAG